MLFSSMVFIYLFLPSVLVIYYVICRWNRLLQNIILFFASILFYAWGEPKFVKVMMGSILLNWFFGLLVDEVRDKEKLCKLVLCFDIIFNIGILFIFKYLTFTGEVINSVFGLNIGVPTIVLPIGISFFTFQATPVSADPVKGFAFYERFTTKDYTDYIKVWFAQGLRHPDSYLNALLAMESGWLSWTKYYPLMDMGWHNQLNQNFFSEDSTVRPESIGKLATGYQKLLDKLYKVPGVGLLFTYGLYAAHIPAFVISTLLSKRRKNGAWVAAMPMIFSLALGCWLAPVSIHFEGRRYLYPITYTALLLIAWCRYRLRLDEESLEKDADVNFDGLNSSGDGLSRTGQSLRIFDNIKSS